MPPLTIDQLWSFLDVEFPQLREFPLEVEALEPGHVRLRHLVDTRHLRPGGTVSGPTLMALADTAMYFAILAAIGPVGLAVTTNLNINFLRRPPPADVIATCDLLKLGQRLAVGQVTMISDGDPAPIAHATATYSIPPRP